MAGGITVAAAKTAGEVDDGQTARTLLILEWETIRAIAPPSLAMVAAATLAGLRYHAFDYAYDNVENAVYATCVHPQIIGQAHHMMWYERLIDHIASKDGVWFTTMDEIAQTWVDDEKDKALMAMEDIRGVEAPPADSSWAQ